MENNIEKIEKSYKTLAEYPDVLCCDDLIKILHVCRKNVYKLLEQDIIKNKKIGRKYIIPKVALIQYLHEDIFN